jgi:hypothetical protein
LQIQGAGVNQREKMLAEACSHKTVFAWAPPPVSQALLPAMVEAASSRFSLNGTRLEGTSTFRHHRRSADSAAILAQKGHGHPAHDIEPETMNLWR